MNNRLLSLDVFRGITVIFMVIVNNPGDWSAVYAPLLHADWHGCTLTDLVFPFFLFIVGVSVVFSSSTHSENPNDAVEKILLRGFKLIALGLFLNFYGKIDFHIEVIPLILQRVLISVLFIILFFGNWAKSVQWLVVVLFITLCLLLMLFNIGDFGTMRASGVLQRIGVVYIIIALLHTFSEIRGIWFCFGLILVGYWVLMAFVPVPNGNGANFDKATNFANWLDSVVLRRHVWTQTKTWDPEGVLSTLPAIATGLAGILAGSWLQQNRASAKNILLGLLMVGGVGIIWGLAWNEVFPINKALWTSSYVLYTAGLASIGLALCYALFDVWKLKGFATPFAIFGLNAMTVFFGSGLIPRILSGIKVLDEGKESDLKKYLYEHGIAVFMQDQRDASLIGAIVFLLIWGVILWIMYRRKVFIKI